MRLRSTYAGVTTSGESVVRISPSFLSASTDTDGTKVVLTYNKTLSTTAASVSAFAVTTASATNTVTAVTIVGATVELTLTATVQNDQAVTVAYTDPSGLDDANAIQDSNGNDASSFAATSVTNISTVAGTAPVFQSAATNEAGTKIILTYDEALSTTPAAASTFSVTSGGSANAVTAVAVSGSTIELTLTNIINDTQSVSFTYTDPSGADDTNAIQDFAGNDAASLTSTSVTNNSTVDGTPPSFQSASTNTLGTLVIMTYDEALSTTTAAPSAFAVTTAGVNNDVTAVAVSGSTVELTLTTIVQNDQSVTVAYTDPSGSDDGNAIQDTTGNDAATLASTAVTNISTVTGTAPVFQSAASNSSGTKVILTYNETLSATAADTSTFAVTVDSSANAVTAVTNVGATVELTLTSAITGGQSITVAYTDPSGSDDVNAIQDTAGNDAASLASTSVTNNVTATNTCTWSMRYHMYGENMGTFEVYVEQSGNFTRILQKIGQQHTSTTDEYDLLTYDLMPSFAGQNIRIYCIQKHEANASFRGDVAIDDLKITTNGTVTNLSGNFAKWQEGGEHSSLSSAKTNSSWTILNTTLDNRSWNIDSGGPTVSSNTGPDMAFNNNNLTSYVYWEASVSGQFLSTTKYYPLRTTDVISVPS